tara:strand:- start:4974 stop:5402 length:429 start_codon:yes stop_codon:yes gene_type:complete
MSDNLIEVIGGKKSQRELAFKVIDFMIKKLMPKFRTLDITVQIKSIPDKDNAWGLIEIQDSNREFIIEVEKSLSLYNFVTSLIHEMIHVKQYVRKELTDEGHNVFWNGEDFSKVAYSKQPWEQEAYTLQGRYSVEFWESDLI